MPRRRPDFCKCPDERAREDTTTVPSTCMLCGLYWRIEQLELSYEGRVVPRRDAVRDDDG